LPVPALLESKGNEYDHDVASELYSLVLVLALFFVLGVGSEGV